MTKNYILRNNLLNNSIQNLSILKSQIQSKVIYSLINLGIHVLLFLGNLSI